MVKGVYLTLLIGPGVPLPAPKSVIDALTGVQVNTGGERTGFQLSFNVSKKSLIRQTLLAAGYFDPIVTRVILVCTLSGIPTVLVDGIVTRQEVAPNNAPGQSTLTVTGEDVSVMMDILDMPFMRYPCMDVGSRVGLILAKYALYGVVPVVIPPLFQDMPSPTEKVPTQKNDDKKGHSTDLAYIKKLAQDCGYIFYIEPGPAPGMNLAYFGPDIRIPVPQAALNVNMDANTNVESLTFSLDGLAKKVTVITILDPFTHKIPIPIPVPNISILRPPLGVRLTPPAKIMFADEGGNKNASEVLSLLLGKTAETAEAVTGSGSLNTIRYGRILRARQLVGVRGAGVTYDGMYYVRTVTHSIKRGEYKQSFTLSRDGLISQTPMVMA